MLDEVILYVYWNLEYKNHNDLFRPKVNHPVFYGCFDWHSSVHGHWLLAALARRYPGTELADNVTAVFNEQFKVPFTIALSHIYTIRIQSRN